MTLKLTSETLAAAYDYLCTTPPFRSWNLPESEDVKFIVNKSPTYFALYQWDGSRHTITVSGRAVAHTSTLMFAMAHECIHLHLEVTGQESTRSGPNHHNAAFRRYAARVCHYHGFDPKAFF